MTARAMVCPACGRKIRQGHQVCPACEQPLPSDVAPPPPSSDEPRAGRSRWTALAMPGAGALVLVLLGAQAWRNEAPSPNAPAPPVENVAVTAPPAPVATDDARVTADASDVPPPFLDVDRAGNLAYRSGQYEDALAHYQQAVEKNPNDGESHSNLGQVLVRFGRAPEAVPHFERAIELNPTRWAYHFNLAYAWGKLGLWSRAVTEYREAAHIFPEDYVTHYNLGRALHESGDEAAAVAAYRRAIGLAPTDPPFHLSLALSYERLGRRGDAKAAYTRYLELVPDGADAEKVRSHLARLEAPGSPALQQRWGGLPGSPARQPGWGGSPQTPAEDPAGRPPQAN